MTDPTPTVRTTTRLDESRPATASLAISGARLVCPHCGQVERDNETRHVDCSACGRPIVEWVREDAA